MLEEKDEIVESSATDEENVDSSTTEETQDSEATEEQAIEETPFHEHPRFKELVEEKNEYKGEMKKLQSQIFELTKPKEERNEKILGDTPDEREFWDLVKKQSSEVAKKMIAEKEQQFDAKFNALSKEYGRIVSNQFLKDNPDIKRGSQELKDILVLAQSKGLELDEARKIVLYDKLKTETVSKKKEVSKKKIEEKIDANQESSDLSSDSVIQPTKKESVSDFVSRQLNKIG